MKSFNIRIVSRLSLVMAVSLLFACGKTMDEGQMIASAKNYLQNNQINNAAIELKNTLQENPANAEARYLLAEVNMRIGDYVTAEKSYLRALDLGWRAEEAVIGRLRALVELHKYKDVIEASVDSTAWSKQAQANLLALKAVSYAASGDMEQADKLLQRATSLDAGAYHVLKVTAQLQLLKKKRDDVAQTLQRALKKYPGDSGLLLLQAHLQILNNQVADALATYQQIISSGKKRLMPPDVRAAYIGTMKLAVVTKDYPLVEKTRDILLQKNVNDPEVFYYMAVSAFEEKDFEKAEEYLQKILKQTTSHAPTLLLSGTVNFAMKRFEQAAYYLAKYVAIDPTSVRAQKLLGRTYMALGQYDDAQNAFNQALKLKSDDAELIALVGLTEINGGAVQSGIEELEKALVLAPDSSSLKKELAKAYIAKGQTDDAIRQLDEVMQNGDEQYQARYMKVLAYLRDKDFDNAIATTQKMLDELPGNADVLNLMGNVQGLSGNNKKAREYFEQAQTASPGHLASLVSLSRLDEAEGKFEAAQQRYKTILAQQPENTSAMVSLARLAAQRGDADGQVEWLQAARKADKKQLVARIALLEIALTNNGLSEAEALLRELEEEHGRNPAVLAVKSRLLMAQKRFIQAESVLNEFIEARPDQDIGYYLQAQNLLYMNKRADALLSLRKAYKLNPDGLRNMVLLARVELYSGNFDRSLLLANKIIKAVPDSAVGYIAKGDAHGARKEYREALAAYDKAWSFTPVREVLLRRFKAKRRLASAEQAYPLLTDWMKEHPDDYKTALELAAAYDAGGKYDEAIKYYEVAVKGLPEDVQVLNNLAWLYRHKNSERALILAEKAYRLQPESSGILDTYGWVLLNKKNASQEELRQAARLLKQAMVELSGLEEVRYHYAVSLIKTGQAEEGRRLVKELLDSGKPFDSKKEAEALMR